MSSMLMFSLLVACDKKSDTIEKDDDSITDVINEDNSDDNDDTAVEGTANNATTHEAEADYVWDASAVATITLDHLQYRQHLQMLLLRETLLPLRNRGITV